MARLVDRDVIDGLARTLQERSWMLATAESCTGGCIAAACTDIPGSSAWFDRGYVTYSNRAKIDMLGIDPALIDAHGAVSEAVARAMARGAQERSGAQATVAVTGIAGPAGSTPAKPVGTVWFAWAVEERIVAERCLFAGDRAAVRAATVRHALTALLALVKT